MKTHSTRSTNDIAKDSQILSSKASASRSCSSIFSEAIRSDIKHELSSSGSTILPVSRSESREALMASNGVPSYTARSLPDGGNAQTWMSWISPRYVTPVNDSNFCNCLILIGCN